MIHSFISQTYFFYSRDNRSIGKRQQIQQLNFFTLIQFNKYYLINIQQGNGHVVYNGSFFYNPENRSSIYRFDLISTQGNNDPMSQKMELKLPWLSINRNNHLYSSEHDPTYVDFDVDENGKFLKLKQFNHKFNLIFNFIYTFNTPSYLIYLL